MTDRKKIRLSAVAVFKAAKTLAEKNVYSPRDWPTMPGGYPLIMVRTPHERKENVSPRNGPPTFFSTITLAVLGRVEAKTEAEAETMLEQLSGQIEHALLTNGQFIYDNEVQQFASVDISMDVRAEGEMHYGETVISFGIEVPQIFEPCIDAEGNRIGPAVNEISISGLDQNTGNILGGIDISLEGA